MFAVTGCAAKPGAFPTPVDDHALRCALLLTENARLMLAETVGLLDADTVLSLRVENASRAARALQESARRWQRPQHRVCNQNIQGRKTFMTAQVGETLHYEGREVVMCNEPLGDYFKLVGIEPEFDANCTALWRGYPLLRELIREAQPSLNEVRAEREAQVEATERSMRTFRAGQWRQIRARLFSLEVADRLAIRLYWDRHRIFPGDPVYLAHVIRQHQAVSRLK